MSTVNQMYDALKGIDHAAFSASGVNVFTGTHEEIKRVEDWFNAVARCQELVQTIKHERELWAKCERDLQFAKQVLEDVREQGIEAHKEMRWGCEDCQYTHSSLCGRICSVLGET